MSHLVRERTLRAALLFLLAPQALLSLPASPKTDNWTDPSPHKNAFVTSNGIQLNYLDWGGKGPTLILIHGFEDNPHVYDDLAPAFTDRFHVLAYAVRGHGRSDAKPPYDYSTLAEDLRGLMDALGIQKAHLAGWSMGGRQITVMAAAHPERVDHLVYLDGAYDWADPAFVAATKKLPPIFDPPPSAMKSLDAFREFQKSMAFASLADMRRVEAYIRELVVVQPDGSVRIRMDHTADQALLHTLQSERRDYRNIHSPALAIYATTMLDTTHGDASRNAELLAWEQNYMAPFRTASMERARRGLPGIEILSVPGTHMDFLFTSREKVVAAIRHFLTEPAPTTPK